MAAQLGRSHRSWAGRRQAEIAFRLIDPDGVQNRPIDVSIDELSTVGLQLDDTDFTDPTAWTLTRSDPALQPYIDEFHPDEPLRILNAVGAAFAGILGEDHLPVAAAVPTDLRPAPAWPPRLPGCSWIRAVADSSFRSGMTDEVGAAPRRSPRCSSTADRCGSGRSVINGGRAT